MTIIRTRLNYVPGALVAIGLALLLWKLPEVLRGQPSAPASPTSQTGLLPADLHEEGTQSQLEKNESVLKDRLDSLMHEASTTEWLLGLVLAAAGLLTVAQGIFAFFSAQTYVKQAEDAIKRANDAVDHANALGEEVRTKFPMFADVESSRADAFRQLSSLTPLLDTDQNLYSRCDQMMRQRVFAIESFSAIQFLTPSTRNADLLANLRLLGKFYAGKFLAEHEPRSDFERSRYYFELALARFDRPFSVLNDLGWLFSTIADPVDLQQARTYFEESLRRKPNQQRALFNLGTIAYERRNRDRLAATLNLLRRAANEPNWEEAPNTQMAAHISYNLACTYDALAELEAANVQASLDDCIQYFMLAAGIGSQPREVVEADLRFGDLRFLGRSDRHRDQVQRALALYRAAWQRLTEA